MATQYTFKGTADMSNHDKAIQKSTNEVKKYKEQCDSARNSAEKISNQDFSGAYRSQQKMENGVKGFTNAMNGASRGLTGMIGKAGIWGAAIAGGLMVGKKALDTLGAHSDAFGDKMKKTAAGVKAGWDTFLNSLANWDFTAFFSRLDNAIVKARQLADILDQQETFRGISNVELANLQNEFDKEMMRADSIRAQIRAAKKSGNSALVQSLTADLNKIISKDRDANGNAVGTLLKILDKMDKLYERQGENNASAREEMAGKYGFGNDAMIPWKARHMMNNIVRDNTSATTHDARWGLFGYYMNAGGDPNWNQAGKNLARLLELQSKLFYAHGGEVYEAQKGFDGSNSGVEAFGRTTLGGEDVKSLARAEWSQLFEELLGLIGEVFNIPDATKLGSEGRGQAVEIANTLTFFNNEFRTAIDKMVSDSNNGEFLNQSMEAAQIQAARIANERRMNAVYDRGIVATAQKNYPKDTIGWYEKQITDLQEKIKSATSTSAIEGFQASIEDYQQKISALKHGEGTIGYIQEVMQRTAAKIEETSDQTVKQQLQAEYNALEAGLLDLQWPQETPQWVAGKIESLKRQLGEAVDDATRESLQAEIDSYTHVLNELQNRNNEIGRIQAEIKQLQDEASRASGDDLHEKVDEIARLNHELNDLQNKKGSINWIQQEINLLNQELNATNSVDDIERLTNRIKELTIELAKLQNLSNINIEIKTNLDLVQDKINNLNSIASSTNQILGDMGAGFGYISEMIQGGKDWDDLSEAQQKTIETMNTLEEVFNRIGQACQAVLQFFTAMMEADLAATHAANTVAIEAETSAINQNTAAKSAGSLTATTLATSLGEETIAHGANATAATADAAASMVSAGAGQADAASTVAAGAAKSAPFPANLAVIAAAIAAVIGIMSVIGSLTKFADGGIVGGNSFVGDRVFARVNSGEMILNDRQQANLFNLLNGNVGPQGGNGGGNVHFEIEGTRLVGVLDNIARSRRRVMG